MNFMLFRIRPAIYREEWIEFMVNNFTNIKFTVFYVHESDHQREWLPIASPSNVKKIFLSNSFKKYYEIIKSIKTQKPDLIMFSGYAYLEHFLGINYAILNKIPYILFGDANAIQKHRVDYNPFYRKILQYIAKRSFKIAYCGSQNKRYWQNLGISDSHLIPLYFPVNNERILKLIENQDEILYIRKEFVREDEILLNYSGRLVAEKGVDTIIKAMEILPDKYKLIIVGDGKERKNLEEKTKKLKLSERVIFLGWKENSMVIKYMRTSDVVVVPSIVEPFGLVVNESVVAGLPVIVSDAVASAYDLVESGKNGFIFKTGDYKDLAESISKIKELKPEDIEKKRAQVLKDFSFEQNAKMLEQIFDELKKRNK